jgi:hypothetical protein
MGESWVKVAGLILIEAAYLKVIEVAIFKHVCVERWQASKVGCRKISIIAIIALIGSPVMNGIVTASIT